MTITAISPDSIDERGEMTIPAPPPAPPAPAGDGSILMLAEHTAYSNPYVSVNFDEVMFPNGAQGNYTRITSGTGLGVVAIPHGVFRGLPYLGLVRQYRYPVGAFTLEFPRGGSDDLSLEEAGRELVEETGLEYTSGSLLGVIHPDTGIMDTRVAVWHTAHRLTDLSSLHVEEETGAKVHWYSHGEIIGLISSGKITCGITLAAMAMLESSGKIVSAA